MSKCSPTDLVLLGGSPAFAEPRCVGTPNLGDLSRLRGFLEDILQRRWLTNDGRYVRQFEAKVAELAGASHAVAMCNATAALQVLFRALGLSGEVILPSFTFVATAHALEWEGLTPVFADIDPVTHNLDPEEVEKLITPRTSAILGVHLWGRPCAIAQLQSIADSHGVKLLFDAAHAIGCSYQNRAVGSFGHAEVFSFHATKVANALEGGVILTSDDQLAERLRKMRNFGFAGVDNVVCLGINAKMHEFSAAMGLCSLDALDLFIRHNYRNQQAYQYGLSSSPGLKVIQYDLTEKNNFQYVIVESDPNQCALTRDEIIQVLSMENIMARRYFYPGCHRMEPYRTRYPLADRRLAQTNNLANRVFSLPTGTTVSELDVANICSVIQVALSNAPLVRSCLRAERLARVG